MKSLVVLVFSCLTFFVAISQQRECISVPVDGSDPAYDGMCAANWDVSYDFTICRVYNGSDGSQELFFAFDNGTATDLETGESYNIKVHSGANLNPGPGSVNRDGGTFHWAGVVAGKIVVQLVIHINIDGNGIRHEVRKNHVRCL